MWDFVSNRVNNKNKNNNQTFVAFIVLELCLLAWFFVWPKPVFAEENSLLISAVAVGIGNANNEFVEIYNPTDSPIDLYSSGIKLKVVSSSETVTKKTITWINKTIAPSSFFLFGTGTISVDLDATYSSGSLTGKGGVILADKNDNIIDSANWTELKTDQVLERTGLRKDALFILGNNPCPRNSSSEIKSDPPLPPPDPEPTPPNLSSAKIRLNEIFPAPSTTNPIREFVELYNSGEIEENLKNWRLQDTNLKSKDTPSFCVLPEIKIAPKKYALFYLANCTPSIALTNSGDSLYLYDPINNTPLSFVSYTKSAPSNKFYSFDGSSWRWTNKSSLEAENKFNNPPQANSRQDDKIYAGIYADFSAAGSDRDGDKLKYTWDFGDDHKSYLKETRHKFEKKGTYSVTLKISDGTEDKLKTFKIKVEKFPESKVKIIALSPNPKGKDSDGEFLTVQNKSKKKINLKNWSVATGSKKLYNHPITQDLWIKPGETLKITRAFSKFSLPNKNAKIELRYPNGKIASHLSYDKKKKTVAEDEIYSKTSGQWAWVAPKTTTKLAVVEVKPKPEISPAKKIAVRKIKLPAIQKDFGQIAGAEEIKQDAPAKATSNYFSKIWTQINSFINRLFLVFF